MNRKTYSSLFLLSICLPLVKLHAQRADKSGYFLRRQELAHTSEVITIKYNCNYHLSLAVESQMKITHNESLINQYECKSSLEMTFKPMPTSPECPGNTIVESDTGCPDPLISECTDKRNVFATMPDDAEKRCGELSGQMRFACSEQLKNDAKNHMGVLRCTSY